MFAHLLERLMPGIYADPDRPRRCPVCAREFAPADAVPTSHATKVCSETCAREFDESSAW